SATIWLADMRYFEDMNSVWDAWMDPANPPARHRGGASGRAQVLRRDRGRGREVGDGRSRGRLTRAANRSAPPRGIFPSEQSSFWAPPPLCFVDLFARPPSRMEGLFQSRGDRA